MKRRAPLTFITSLIIMTMMAGCVPSATVPAMKNSTTVEAPPPNKAAPVKGEELTLAECYDLALIQSERLAIDHQLLLEAEAHFMQAIGTMLPHASYMLTETQQDLSKLALSQNLVNGDMKSSEQKFNVKQTLFDGFKNLAGVTGSNLETRQRASERKRAEQQLLSDVASAFYLLAERQEDIRSLRSTESALNQRIQHLRQRESLGRSRRSEVVTAMTQLYSVQASLEQARSDEEIFQHLMEFFTGRPRVSAVRYTIDLPSLSPMALDPMLLKIEKRPDVVASYNSWMVMKKAVIVANSDFFPTVDLEGNYYTKRPANMKGIDWDVMLKVNAPIFEGTETIGSVMEANTKEKQAMLLYQQTKRLAVQDLKDSFTQYTIALNTYKALKKAYGSAELNYHLQKKDYDLNLVNNLDVLSAIQTLQNARRDYIHALFDVKRFYWALLVASGEANKEGLRDPLRPIY